MHKTVYYHPLVRWEKVDEIVFLVEPVHQASARELVMKTLDHVVMEAALHALSEEEHEAFLQLCQERYHDEALLEWLEERQENIREHLTRAIQETKQEMRELLISEGIL